MNKTAIFVALALFLPLGAVQAAEIDDLTMQVMDSNDPADTMKEIELPEVEKSAVDGARVSSESQDAMEQESEDHKNEATSEMESEVDDAKQDVEDDVESTRDEVDDVKDEVEGETEEVESDSSGS